jgi:hypothetical protein
MMRASRGPRPLLLPALALFAAGIAGIAAPAAAQHP